MKRSLLLILISVLGGGAFAQCTPDPLYADSVFGVWPDTTINFSPADLDMPYFQQLDVLVPSDAGLINEQFEGVVLDSVQFTGITGLPPGLTVACSSQTPAACTYLAGQLGCGVIQGTPTQAGVFDLVVEVTAYSSFLGSPLPIPYQFQGYRIEVLENVSVGEIALPVIGEVRNVPNPFATRTAFEFQLARNMPVDIRVFNLLGEELWSQKINGKAGVNKIPFESGDLQEGVYLYKVESGSATFTGRMVLHR